MHSHADLDEHTARLSVQLQLEDLSKVSSNTGCEGSHSAHGADDFICAATLYENDLKTVNDRYMARSIAHAVRTDGNIIKDVLAEEHQASKDRRMALQANGTTASALPTTLTGAAVAEDDGIDEDLLEEMCAVYMGDDEVDSADEEDDIRGNDSVPCHAATHPVAWRQCCSCRDAVPNNNFARTTCGHEYCHSCLERLFTLSLTDETMFPPRCCGEPFPTEENRSFLGLSLLANFFTRKVEMETTDRTYCHAPGCRKFILPQHIRHQIGRCPACDKTTCTVCKDAAHVGDCPEDPSTKALESIAAEKGWRRCNNCRRMVELKSGCNHITCPCGAQFCYLCGEAWRTCTCVVYTEEQLLRRADALVDRDAGARREIELPQIRQQIRQNHFTNAIDATVYLWGSSAHVVIVTFKFRSAIAVSRNDPDKRLDAHDSLLANIDGLSEACESVNCINGSGRNGGRTLGSKVVQNAGYDQAGRARNISIN